MKNNIDINEISKILPHRYPFLLVDRVLEFQPGKMITGLKNVTINEPYFVGHFPDMPIMPGVLIIEAMAQVSAILVAKTMSSTHNNMMYLSGVEEAKFRKAVVPGDSLIITSVIKQSRSQMWKFTVQAKVADKLVSEAIISTIIKEK